MIFVEENYSKAIEKKCLSEERIAAFQKYLFVLRAFTDWSSEELAHKVGVARPTMYGIEIGRIYLRQTVYLACLMIFRMEIEYNQNQALAHMLTFLVYDDAVSEEVKAEVYERTARLVKEIGTRRGCQYRKEVLLKAYQEGRLLPLGKL